MINCVMISCSDDIRYLRVTLKQAAHLFQQVLIMFGTRYWDGVRDEDISAIQAFDNECKSLFSNVKIIWYQVPEDALKFLQGSVSQTMYWEGHARWLAVTKMAPCEYVLFLDSDEVIDGKEMEVFLASKNYTHCSAIKLANYWYWREPIYQAKDYTEDSAVLIKTSHFNALDLYSNQGRHGIFAKCHPSETKRSVMGCNGVPIIHHYSWVRTKEEMLRKVTTWGHRNDRSDWVAKVEEEYSRAFNGTDFVNGLEYIMVPDYFGLQEPIRAVSGL